MTDFVEVTIARIAPPVNAEMKAILERDEWDRLRALAEALPNTLTWTAQPHEGAGHKSGGVGIAARVDEHAEPASPENVPCPRECNDGLIERLATPEEVDAGCEFGIAFDPCPACNETP